MNCSQKILIVGPCALESREQLRSCSQVLQAAGINYIRASLWKPRTKPGWEGMGLEGLPILLEETLPIGMTPATEVVTIEQAQAILQALRAYDKRAPFLMWIGARNQNHFFQRDLSRLLATSENPVLLMAKNPMWKSLEHWMGMVSHLKEGGIPSERLILCHRGFFSENTEFRNEPDFAMAMAVKEASGLQMILDPSHISGSREKLEQVMHLSSDYAFDGYIIEAHLDPKSARTDASQQLSLAGYIEFAKKHNLLSPEKEYISC